MSKNKFRIKAGDTVLVTTGKDKGKTGKVLRVLPEKEQVIVEGVRRVKRHQRPVGDMPGGIIEKEAPIHISNVAFWDADAGSSVKVGFQVIDGKKVRVNRKSGAALDNA